MTRFVASVAVLIAISSAISMFLLWFVDFPGDLAAFLLDALFGLYVGVSSFLARALFRLAQEDC